MLRSSAKSSSPVSIWATRVATSGTGIHRISSTQAVFAPPYPLVRSLRDL